jgi:hypothetical protein
MIAAVTFSTDNFESIRKKNVTTAIRKGKVDKVFEYTPKDIDSDFFNQNKCIFNYQKGAGLWLWKPYFIARALAQINEGDYLIYSDAGSYFINPVNCLIESLEQSPHDVMVFELPLISKQWTKKETFLRMEVDFDLYGTKNQILANHIFIKKSAFSVSFISEFLKICCDEVAISNKQFDSSIVESEDFLAHRMDQSILSILSQKKGLIPFRDPSQFGDRPWEYLLSSEVLYNPKKYNNSNYPTIFFLTRQVTNYNLFYSKEIIKRVLSIFPSYVKWEIIRRNKKSQIYKS